jgi:hypothetical protein
VDSDDAVVKKNSALSRNQNRPVPPTWNEIGEGFETLGKVGLAMAIGFSAAGLFCRLAEQGKVRVPSLSGLVLNNQGPARSVPQSPDPA